MDLSPASSGSEPLSKSDAEELCRKLLHKEGTWVDWGRMCARLQAAGYSTSQIFEATGFQASQQNLVTVAAQVYGSVESSEPNSETLSWLRGPKTDVAHELRILNHKQRASAAEFAARKNLDVDGARELAKAMRDFRRTGVPPSAFTDAPGDTLAYQSWRRARQTNDLVTRSRFIAQGLKTAETIRARESLEELLSDFSITASQKQPL
ncbi:MAG: RuBisCO accumulation factor 1, partial [Cyanobacteria bacterium P01_H01_bin.15]